MATDIKPSSRDLSFHPNPGEVRTALMEYAEREFPGMTAIFVVIRNTDHTSDIPDATACVTLRPAPTPEPVKRTRKAKGAA